MEFKIHENRRGKIAEVQTEEVYSSVSEFLDIIGTANYLGAEAIIINKQNIHADFFDLKTKLAGEILQKFSTYQQRLAIIGDFSNYKSKSLNDFIKESNKFGRIMFLNEVDEAIEKL